MEYNIHPIVVHFPIALLMIYSLIKILPMKKWFPKTDWKPTEQILLLVGVIGIFIAAATGEEAEKLFKPDHDILEMHELFANITTFIYVFLLAIEFLPLTNDFIEKKKWVSAKIMKFSRKIEKLINQNWLVVLLSIAGILSLSITGLLGGVMVYGETADPIAPFVLKMLGL